MNKSASLICILYLIAWCISPPLAYGTTYRLLAFGATAILLTFHIGTFDKRQIHAVFGSFLIIAYTTTVSLITGEPLTFKFGLYVFLSLALCMNVVINEESNKAYRLALPFTFLLGIVWNISSLNAVANSPNIMRMLAKESDDAIVYARQGVGGYGYLYSMVVILPIAIDVFLDKRNSSKVKLLAFGFVATTYILVFKSGYFLALVLSVMIVPLYYVMKMERTQAKYGAILFLSMSLVLFMTFADDVLMWLYDVVNVQKVQDKILSILEMLKGDSTIEDSSFSTRYERYVRSLLFALTHPVLGGFRFSLVGKHSHLLDFAAQYGIPLLLFYLNIILKPFKTYKLIVFPCVNLVVLSVAFVLLFNSLPQATGVALFLLSPIYSRLLAERNANYYG